MTETWLPVVGYEGLYEVSDQGRVRGMSRRVERSNGVPQAINPRIRKAASHKSGHLYLTLSRRGESRKWLVHRLVALAFIPNPEGHPNVLHGDNDPTHNAVTNLRWGTQAENMEDARRSGTSDPWGHKRNPKPDCPSGHPYAGENLYMDPRGRRVCRACKREWARRKHGYRTVRVHG